MKTTRFFTTSLLALIALAAVGCEQGPRRFNVSGSITYDGQPLPAGVIWFDPDYTQGNNDGLQGYAYIKAGKYDSAETESGPTGGKYIVRIEGFDGKPGVELPMGSPIITDFSQPIDLPGEDTTRDFAVPAKK